MHTIPAFTRPFIGTNLQAKKFAIVTIGFFLIWVFSTGKLLKMIYKC